MALSNFKSTQQHSRPAANESGVVVKAFRRLFLRSSRVVTCETVSPHFRLIELESEGARDTHWTPGQHIQLFFAGLTHRTYTPLSWNGATGRIALLIYLHGEAPGSSWARYVQEGDEVDYSGPSRSVDLIDSKPVIVFGDETSFGLAYALKAATFHQEFQALFEVADLEESRIVLQRLGLEKSICVQRSDSRAHLGPLINEVSRRAMSGSLLALTGNARSIQTVKKQLNAAAAKSSVVRVKPYWVEGKTGLD